jgi:peptide/nickel transport system permease protein
LLPSPASSLKKRLQSSTFLSVIFRAAASSRMVQIGLIITAFFAGIALLSIFYVPYAVWEPVGPSYSPPSWTFLFGTTSTGQDVFSQWLYGSQWTLLVGVIAAAMTAYLGIFAGILSGYMRLVDGPFMRLADVVLTIPTLPLLIVIGAFYSPSYFNVAVLIAVLSWAAMARTLRSEVLTLKNQQFVEVAIQSNFPKYKIMFVDMVRHTMPLILTYSLFAVGDAILTIAALNFIGVGPVSIMTWGTMLSIAEAQGALYAGAWWWEIAPGLSIAVFVAGLAFIAYGLEAAFKKM